MNKYKFKESAVRILLTSLSIFLSLIITETALRVAGYYYSPLKIRRLGKEIDGLGRADFRQHHEAEDAYFIFDPHLIWRPKKNFRIFNSQGFRGPEVDIKNKNNTYYIFTIGVSLTLGPTLSPAWPDYLGELCSKLNKNIKVVNAGAWGYSSYQGFERFKEVLQYKPDMVVVCFGANDALVVTIPDKEYISSKKFFHSELSDVKIFQLFFAFQDKILLKKFDEERILVPRVNIKDYKNYLNEMITLANKNHVKVVLLTRPFAFPIPHRLSWKNFIPQYNELTLKVAKERGISAMDICSYFKGKDEYFFDEAHLNDDGYKIMAETIYEQIKYKIQ